MGVLKAYTLSSTWPWWWWHFETFQRLPRHKTSPTIHRASFVVLKKSCNDLRYQTWLLGATGRLIFFVSSSQNHGRRLWVSLTYKDHLPDWTRKSNRTTTTSSFASNLDSMPRLVYLRRATSCPNFAFSTSSRGNLAHLRRARWHCKDACTEFRSSRFPLLSEGFRSQF